MIGTRSTTETKTEDEYDYEHAPSASMMNAVERGPTDIGVRSRRLTRHRARVTLLLYGTK